MKESFDFSRHFSLSLAPSACKNHNKPTLKYVSKVYHFGSQKRFANATKFYIKPTSSYDLAYVFISSWRILSPAFHFSGFRLCEKHEVSESRLHPPLFCRAKVCWLGGWQQWRVSRHYTRTYSCDEWMLEWEHWICRWEFGQKSTISCLSFLWFCRQNYATIDGSSRWTEYQEVSFSHIHTYDAFSHLYYSPWLPLSAHCVVVFDFWLVLLYVLFRPL